jgi:16S rRNA (uracil1498-N3)-methyltransferase
VERGDRAPVATFYALDLTPGDTEVSLGQSAAHHAAVRRLAKGDMIHLTNGAGVIGVAEILRLGKRELVARLEGLDQVPPLPLLEVLVPVAERDRMLWLAEKCAEMAVTVWQPVIFSRSRSVVPRGEGEAFAAKVRARMISALEQSGGAWLPEVRRELPLADALSTIRAPTRYLLDRGGSRVDSGVAQKGVAVAFGPEGGIVLEEHELLRGSGWRPAGLGPTTLRFETAGIAAVAILRAGTTTVSPEG